jgi:hypothetical protein
MEFAEDFGFRGLDLNPRKLLYRFFGLTVFFYAQSRGLFPIPWLGAGYFFIRS